MAISFAQLQDLLKKEGYRYFIAPDQSVIRFTVTGRFGQYEIAIFLQEQGVFFQFRTIGYLRCPADHPHLKGVLQTLSAINYQMRYLKLGWDPASGEIAGYGDGWVMDNQVTQQQFQQVGNTEMIGYAIYSKYIYPFEAVSVLLLISIIGAVMIAKKDKT